MNIEIVVLVMMKMEIAKQNQIPQDIIKKLILLMYHQQLKQVR